VLSPPNIAKETHISRSQKALIGFYHGHVRCETNKIEKLVLGVPHRFTDSKLQMNEGYGIYAKQGFSMVKGMLFALVTQCWAIAFAAWWLWHHPGDLQNASIPAFYSLAFVALFVAIPDIFLS
jgi:hypothetical protein